jgi:hypothetical protein
LEDGFEISPMISTVFSDETCGHDFKADDHYGK